MVHMANGTHIHMGLVAHVGLLGLHGKTATQEGRCPGFQRPQPTLQQWGRAGTETCGEKELGVVKGVDSNLATSMPLMSPGCLHPTRPLTAEAGRRS